MSANLTTIDDVRALVSTPLSDAQVMDIIKREEAALARKLFWPAGLGEPATQHFFTNDPALRGMYIDTAFFTTANRGRALSFGWVTSNISGPLWLLRPTDAVEVRENGTLVPDHDIRLLRRGTMIEKATGAWRQPEVTVSYTPNDLDEVRAVVIDLFRLTVTETGYESESIGDYSYRRQGSRAGKTITELKAELIRPLRTHWPVATVRIAGSNEDRRIGGIVAS